MTPFEILSSILLVVLVLTVIVAAAIIVQQFKASREVAVNLAVDTADFAHHVQVSAVLALTETFTDNPELSANLAGYSQQVVDAALLHRVNSLGRDLQNIDERISYYSQLAAHNPQSPSWRAQVQAVQDQRDAVQRQLDAANQVVNGRRLHAV